MTGSTANTTAPRLFVPVPLNKGTEVAIPADQAHYLATVMRRAAGDPVRLFNGADGEWIAHVAAAGGASAGRSNQSGPSQGRAPRAGRAELVLIVDDLTRSQASEDGPWLVFALLKRDATDLVVRQAVELGASRVLPVITERTNAARVNEDRLRAIAVEAAEQSERLTIPAIAAPCRLESLLAAWPPDRRLFVAFERSGANRPVVQSPENNALLIGPEGGFTAREREMLGRMAWVTPISLGPFVLRAETAAAAGMALLLPRGSPEYVGAT